MKDGVAQEVLEAIADYDITTKQEIINNLMDYYLKD